MSIEKDFFEEIDEDFAEANVENLPFDLSSRIINNRAPDDKSFWNDPKLGVSQSGIELDAEQSLCIRGIFDSLNKNISSLYIEAPTGWGKTVMAMKLLELLRLGNVPAKAIIVANDVGDLWRWRDEFEKHDPILGNPKMSAEKYVGVYYADEKEYKSTTIITYASFVKAVQEGIIKPNDLDLIILDEGHKSLSELRQEVLNKLNAVQLSLSATPAYSREKSLDKHSVCAYSCTPQRAEELGLIAPFQQVIIIQPKVSLDNDVLQTTGSYNLGILKSKFKDAHVTQSFINFYKDWENAAGQSIFGRQGIVNCLSVQHADDVAKEINEVLGSSLPTNVIPAVSLNGNTPKKFRKWAIDQYKLGNILILCGDELFVHGFDAPNVDFVFNMSPSTSGVIVGQRGGRARRRDRTGQNPNKVAVIADILYENVSPRGWQLLYSEWISSRLFQQSEDFPFFDLDSSNRNDKKKQLEKLDIDWSKVPADTIIDNTDDINRLVAWREQKWSELRPAPLWTTRFPLVWKRMRDLGINNNEAFKKFLASVDPDLKGSKLMNIISGMTKHFNPNRYSDCWHPVCLRVAKVLGAHVSHLFPIPDDWDGPITNTPERKEYLRYRESIAILAKQNGFETLTELAEFLEMTTQRLNGFLNKRWENYKKNGAGNGEWHESAQKIANALMSSPEELFGEPPQLSKAKLDWKNASTLSPSLIPDPNDPFRPNEGINPREEFDRASIQDKIGNALLKLSPRLELVLTYRYGLRGHPELTLDEVGEIFGVTRERIRQMEMKALRTLRHPSKGRKLEPLLDLFN